METSRIASASSLVPSSAVAVFCGRWRAAAWRAGAVRECGRALRGRACISVRPPTPHWPSTAARVVSSPRDGPTIRAAVAFFACDRVHHDKKSQTQTAPCTRAVGWHICGTWDMALARGGSAAAARKTQHIACKIQGLSHTCLRTTYRISLAERADQRGRPNSARASAPPQASEVSTPSRPSLQPNMS